jgi:phosphoribosylaminoimidazole carboxylase / phosphoribosylaminoimidazole-succinocarboxamide synthase
MMAYKTDELLHEGKTKRIFALAGDNDNVLIENKDDITKFDDSSLTESFNTKAVYATTTTCRVFELLKKAGIPVAYKEQVSPNQFVVDKCEMVPLEVVARRYAVGSFLKRHPELKKAADQQPYRFHRLEGEFFLKTTGGKLEVNGKTIVDGFDAKAGTEDPFIGNPYEDTWNLFHPKKPSWVEGCDLSKSLKMFDAVVTVEMMHTMEEILRKVFLTLEGAWSTLGLRLIDMKIEFGINTKGELLVADVIDNDSWRLRDSNWKELSKESFRQGEELSEVEKKYGTVADLASRFHMPKQALVFWRASESDDLPDFNKDVKFEDVCDIIVVTKSGHKSTRESIDLLEDILGKYPDGGVVVAKVGRSNGLGPVVAARTSWPVIAIPATAAKNPEDVWSSIRMPSLVPLMTVWPEGNALLAAANILGQKNPAIYGRRQLGIEKQDY